MTESRVLVDEDDLFAELGPVDYLVVEFPVGSQNFSGEMARQLSNLLDRRLVRIFDIVVIEKGVDGRIEVLELADRAEGDPLRAFDVHVAAVLTEADLRAIAESVVPGSVAGVVVWENSWAAPFASSVRRAGGQLIASGRIPIQAIVAVLEDESGGENTG
jgi:hypothetical protein